MPAPFSIELVNYFKQLLDYNPETGDFTWKVARMSYARGVRPGDVAGTVGRHRLSYVQIGIDGRIYRAHILAYWFMIGQAVPEGFEIDHRDRCRSNNVWSNLRLRTRSGNNLNRSPQSNNTSGVRGVHKGKGSNTWFARIQIGKVVYPLGTFQSYEEAVAARRAGELKHLGEYNSDRDRGAVR